MKFKLYFLLVALWAAPALGMEQPLTAETVVNHPKFVALKQACEEIGATLKVMAVDRLPDELKSKIYLLASRTIPKALKVAEKHE